MRSDFDLLLRRREPRHRAFPLRLGARSRAVPSLRPRRRAPRPHAPGRLLRWPLHGARPRRRDLGRTRKDVEGRRGDSSPSRGRLRGPRHRPRWVPSCTAKILAAYASPRRPTRASATIPIEVPPSTPSTPDGDVDRPLPPGHLLFALVDSPRPRVRRPRSGDPSRSERRAWRSRKKPRARGGYVRLRIRRSPRIASGALA